MDEMKYASNEIKKQILRWKWVILTITLLFLLMGGVYQGIKVKPIYRETIQFSFSHQGNDNRIFNVINFANLQLQTDTPVATAPTLDTEEIIAKYKKFLKEDAKLLAEIRQLNTNYKDLTSEQLSGKIQVSLIPNSKTINLTTIGTNEKETSQLGQIVARHFDDFIYSQNYKALNQELLSLQRYLDLNISLLNKHIEKSKEDLEQTPKTIDYGKGIIEPNPGYDVYLQQITEEKIIRNKALIQLAEIEQIEKLLPQLAKETGIMVTADLPMIQKSPSDLVMLLKVILSGIAGLIISLFGVLILGNRKQEKR